MDQTLYSRMASVEDTHWWFAARRMILESIIAGRILPSGADILEAGCGTGGNLAMLASRGHVHATEMNIEAMSFAVSRGIGDISAGRLPDDIGFGTQGFDLIVLLDVLEHIDDDCAALRALRKRLNPNGWLVVTVPAYPVLWGHHDEIHHHKRRYTLKTLCQAARTAGCSVSYVSHFNFWLFPAIALVRLVRRWTSSTRPENLMIPPSWLNAALTGLLASERYFLGRRRILPFGLSLVLVAQSDLNDSPAHIG
ncbi:MAG TPA: class I SAM-dependent methyltransferase [Nitrospirales bacterium]